MTTASGQLFFLGGWMLRVGCWVFVFLVPDPKGVQDHSPGQRPGISRPNNAPQAEGLQEALAFLQPFRLQVVFWFSQSRGVAPGYVLAPFQGAGADRVSESGKGIRVRGSVRCALKRAGKCLSGLHFIAFLAATLDRIPFVAHFVGPEGRSFADEERRRGVTDDV